MQKITPFLWFNAEAEEAAKYYVEIFSKNPAAVSGLSKMGKISYYGEEGIDVTGKPAGSVMVAVFDLEGQTFQAINGGSHFKFSGAISFVVDCKTQEEIDYFWEALSEGGEKGQCGWINRDKFGVTWQITPAILPELMSDPDKEKAGRVMNAMLKMTKIDIQALKDAAGE